MEPLAGLSLPAVGLWIMASRILVKTIHDLYCLPDVPAFAGCYSMAFAKKICR